MARLTGRPRRVIDMLRQGYPGKWKYDARQQVYTREDGAFACWRAILGGPCGDDYVGRDLYIYFPDKQPPQRVLTNRNLQCF